MPDRDCLLVGKGPAMGVGKESLETVDLGGCNQVADTVGYMIVGMGHQEVSERGWREDKH